MFKKDKDGFEDKINKEKENFLKKIESRIAKKNNNITSELKNYFTNTFTYLSSKISTLVVKFAETCREICIYLGLVVPVKHDTQKELKNDSSGKGLDIFFKIQEKYESTKSAFFNMIDIAQFIYKALTSDKIFKISLFALICVLNYQNIINLTLAFSSNIFSFLQDIAFGVLNFISNHILEFSFFALATHQVFSILKDFLFYRSDNIENEFIALEQVIQVFSDKILDQRNSFSKTIDRLKYNFDYKYTSNESDVYSEFKSFFCDSQSNLKTFDEKVSLWHRENELFKPFVENFGAELEEYQDNCSKYLRDERYSIIKKLKGSLDNFFERFNTSYSNFLSDCEKFEFMRQFYEIYYKKDLDYRDLIHSYFSKPESDKYLSRSIDMSPTHIGYISMPNEEYNFFHALKVLIDQGKRISLKESSKVKFTYEIQRDAEFRIKVVLQGRRGDKPLWNCPNRVITDYFDEEFWEKTEGLFYKHITQDYGAVLDESTPEKRAFINGLIEIGKEKIKTFENSPSNSPGKR